MASNTSQGRSIVEQLGEHALDLETLSLEVHVRMLFTSFSESAIPIVNPLVELAARGVEDVVDIQRRRRDICRCLEEGLVHSLLDHS